MAFPALLLVSLHPSRLRRLGLLVFHLAAAGALALAALPWLVRLVFGAALLISLVFQAGELQPSGIRVSQDGILELELAGHWQSVEYCAAGLLLPWLVFLHCRLDCGACNLILLPDAVEREDFRRLRVWLKWRVGAGQG